MLDPRTDPNAFAVAIDPPGQSWLMAGRDIRTRYYQEVGRLAAPVKDLELARGLDRFGRPMVPIAEATRKARRQWDYSPMGRADPAAPPLTPCRAASRTRSLLRYAAYPDGCWFFWAYDPHTGRPWGEILDYHRAGGGNLPVRDVIGLSVKAIQQVKRKAWAWWQATGGKGTSPGENPREAAVRPGGVVVPRAPIGAFSTGFRQLKSGRFESISVVHALTPLYGGR